MPLPGSSPAPMGGADRGASSPPPRPRTDAPPARRAAAPAATSTPKPATHGFGLFGPDFGYPGGGFCVSAFVAVRRGDEVLVGTMAPHEAWEQEWAPNLRFYEGLLRRGAFERLRFPGTYLRVGEDPLAAARRVWVDQLGIAEKVRFHGPRILSEAGPSRRYPGEQHWDVVFLYEAAAPARDLALPSHWSNLTFQRLPRLEPVDFGMGHGELLAMLAAPGGTR